MKTTPTMTAALRMRTLFVLVALLLLGGIGSSLANKSSNRVQRRSDTIRAEQETRVREATVMQTPWSAPRIRSEVTQRYPVAAAVGALTLRYGVNDPRLEEFVRLLQPELAKLDEMMSRPVFFGYQLPNEVGSELASMRARLGQLISDVYGENVRREIWADLHYAD